MNNKKKILIVAKSKPTTGIGATVVQYFKYIICSWKGYIPVVDMKHYTNQYFKDGRTFKDNAWEYFFEQPCGYTLEDIENSLNCVVI